MIVLDTHTWLWWISSPGQLSLGGTLITRDGKLRKYHHVKHYGSLITRLKLKPGQKGTKKLLEKHGEALVCVRYRYDAESCARIKTVELIVERIAWQPPAQKFEDNDLVAVRIGFMEADLKQAAKAAKGRWNPDVKLWFIRFGKITETTFSSHQ